MIRPAIVATLDDLRRLATELDQADKAIAAHVVRKATAVLAAELRRLGELVPLVLEPQEDDGDPDTHRAWPV